jgi:3-methyladenine DNA glycosylase AlkD
MPYMLQNLHDDFEKLADAEQAVNLQRFFKTGKGQYGEGDIFLGLKVPVQRKLAKEYHDLSINDVTMLLQSKIHEHRLTALLILMLKYKTADDKTRKTIFTAYLKHRKWINNWDLVDCSALYIVGAHLMERDKRILYRLARSKNLWQRRIAVLATFYFIQYRRFDDALQIAEILLTDPEDLIHKAVGWMLREIGKRDLSTEERFLKRHCRDMPRTMLRYAIEKFPEQQRQRYLKSEKSEKS